jgi:OmpA-OmpF porin, OOP family
MKKIALSALLAATLVSASDYNYEITPMAGYVYPSGQRLNNHTAFGGEFQYNAVDSLLKPELSAIWSNADYEYKKPHATDIWRTAINGVYDYKTSNHITPFAKAGLGYEQINDRGNGIDNLNHNGAFADVGAGVKMGITDQIALKLEAIEMLKFNHFDWDNSLLLMAGLNFAFDKKAAPVIPVPVVTPEPVVVPAPVVVPKPEPVVVPAPKPVVIPAPVVVPAPKPVVVAPIDSDKDGVFDPKDKCPGTPSGFKVDADGCPLSATLHLKFATNSNTIDADGTAKIAAFSTFLKESPAYKASITGHTDSSASDAYNQKLSEKRAEMIKSMLVKDGVEADRLTASGKGESQPVATNKTKEGRAENRRIEVELSH